MADITNKTNCSHCGQLIGFEHQPSYKSPISISPNKFGIVKKLNIEQDMHFDRYANSTNYSSILKVQLVCTQCKKKQLE